MGAMGCPETSVTTNLGFVISQKGEGPIYIAAGTRSDTFVSFFKRTVFILITVHLDATQSSLFIILQVNSTCFGCQPHPSLGVHKTVTTASGTGHIFCAATSLHLGQVGHVGGR